MKKEELQQEINNAHFGLMAYYADSPQGWPNKLFEYMANGLPMINLLKGESWELIEQKDLGINIQRDNLTKLSDWLHYLSINPHAYEAISKNNISCFNENFSREKTFQKLLVKI